MIRETMPANNNIPPRKEKLTLESIAKNIEIKKAQARKDYGVAENIDIREIQGGWYIHEGDQWIKLQKPISD